MSEDTAWRAFEDALEALQKDGTVLGVSATVHQVSPARLFTIADEVRTSKRANVSIERNDNGTLSFKPGRGV